MIVDPGRDVTVTYSPASGGFYFFHQLLLSGHHWTKFHLSAAEIDHFVNQLSTVEKKQLRVTRPRYFQLRQNHWPSYPQYYTGLPSEDPEILQLTQHWAEKEPANLEDIRGQWPRILTWIVDHQWTIADPQQWKSTEYHCDNFNPVPNDYQYFENLPQQYRRAYLNISNYSHNTAFSGQQILLYTDIKTQFQMSAYKHAGDFPYLVEAMQNSNHTVEFLGLRVSKDVAAAAESAHTVIYLQDFVNNQIEFLGPMNPAQQALRQRWLALHPPELLQQVGIYR